LWNWLRKNVGSYSIVHIHSVFSFPSAAAMYWSRKRGIPYIVRPLGSLTQWSVKKRRPFLKRVWLAAIERPALARAAMIHFTSALEMQEAEDCRVAGHGQIIPNGIPFPAIDSSLAGTFRSRYGISANATLVIFLSRVDAKKGLDLLIPAFAKARQRRSDLVLAIVGAGDPAFVAQLKDLARQASVGDFVVWTGYLDGAAKTSGLVDSDIFVLPSYSENFGVAVLEAMAAEKAVIVSDKVALATDIWRRDAGIVTQCSIAELAAAILSLAGQPRLRVDLGKRARDLALKEFSSQVLVDRLIAAYEALL
jgi:glycosyltransferase involved in cell wall biosynthesis